MSDMSTVIVPKSDQINADDLIAGPMTIKITGVKVSPGTEQPVSIFFDGSEKAYRCCKSMARVLVSAWGADSSKYVGRSLTLYCDPKVKWGGMEVGGIRISHMSDIDSAITLALTMTRANKKPFTVRPLKASKESAAAQVPSHKGADETGGAANPAPSADLITPDQIAAIETRCQDHGISIDRVKAAAKVGALSEIQASRYAGAMAWLDKQIDAMETT